MKEKIIISVVSSCLGAILAFIGGYAFNLFEVKIKETQIEAVASEIVNGEVYRNVLIRKMNDSNLFIGLQGPQGIEGPLGETGSTADICNRIVALQGRSGNGHFIGENDGQVYSRGMPNAGDYEKFAIRCQ